MLSLRPLSCLPVPFSLLFLLPPSNAFWGRPTPARRSMRWIVCSSARHGGVSVALLAREIMTSWSPRPLASRADHGRGKNHPCQCALFLLHGRSDAAGTLSGLSGCGWSSSAATANATYFSPGCCVPGAVMKHCCWCAYHAALAKTLLPEAEFISRERFSRLTYAGQKKTRLRRRSALLPFPPQVYRLASLSRRGQGSCDGRSRRVPEAG